MSRYRIVLADPHTLFRQGVRRIIEEVPNLKVVGEAEDGLLLLHLFNSVKPEMVILDVDMPFLRGIEASLEMKKIRPEIKTLILTVHGDFLHEAVFAGTHGYLLKRDTDVDLQTAIQTIREGRRYISRFLSSQMVDLLANRREGDRAENAPDLLSLREREVLKLLADGKFNKEIAGVLCISERTVEHHRANIMKKLKIRRNVDLIKYAIKRGYTVVGILICCMFPFSNLIQ